MENKQTEFFKLICEPQISSTMALHRLGNFVCTIVHYMILFWNIFPLEKYSQAEVYLLNTGNVKTMMTGLGSDGRPEGRS